jgi:hypothetical protein
MNNFFLLRWYRSGCGGKILSVIVGLFLLCLLISIPVFLVPLIENYDPLNKFKEVCFGGKVEGSEKYQPGAVERGTIPAIAFYLPPDPVDIGDIYKQFSWVEDPDDISLVACITRVGEAIKDDCDYSGGRSYTIQHYHAVYQVEIFEANSGNALDDTIIPKLYDGDDCPPRITTGKGEPIVNITYAELEKSEIEAHLLTFMNP